MRFFLAFTAGVIGATHAIGVDHANVALVADTGDNNSVDASVAVSSTSLRLRGADGGTQIESQVAQDRPSPFPTFMPTEGTEFPTEKTNSTADSYNDYNSKEHLASQDRPPPFPMFMPMEGMEFPTEKTSSTAGSYDDYNSKEHSESRSSSFPPGKLDKSGGGISTNAFGKSIKFGDNRLRGADGGTKTEEIDNEGDGMDDSDELRDFLKLEAAMTQGTTNRDNWWLHNHNKRRKLWHEWFGKSYVPLNWSNTLKGEAQQWAVHLANSNQFYHDQNRGNRGENLAMNWGDKVTTESVVYRWVEEEADKTAPGNGHLTQVLWRASHWVGCGEASRGNRHYQVCRYYVPGNCAVSNGSKNYSKMLQSSSPCK